MFINNTQELTPSEIDNVLLTLVSFFSSTVYYHTQINSKGNVSADIWIVKASLDLHFDRSLPLTKCEFYLFC
jgi:hypothetical protein